MPTPKIPSALLGLFRGELSALDTYRWAIEREPAPLRAQLLEIYLDHWFAVDVLRGLLSRFDGEAPTSSGVWGAFARAHRPGRGGAPRTTALRALKEGEGRRIKEYQRVLLDPEVDAEIKETVRRELLGLGEAHIAVIEEMIFAEVAAEASAAAREAAREAAMEASREAAREAALVESSAF